MTPPKTKNGYNFYEVMSALQKDIRRGNEEEAVFWALELESFNAVVLWKRLKVIASEDIGTENNQMAVLIPQLESNYHQFKKGNDDGWRLFVVHAALALSRSYKSREVDELVSISLESARDENLKPHIPEYAYDMHTWQGKRQGRGLKHFYEVAAVINPTSEGFRQRSLGEYPCMAGEENELPMHFSKYTARAYSADTANSEAKAPPKEDEPEDEKPGLNKFI